MSFFKILLQCSRVAILVRFDMGCCGKSRKEWLITYRRVRAHRAVTVAGAALLRLFSHSSWKKLLDGFSESSCPLSSCLGPF